VCFLTNGGGVIEAAKAKELSAWLDVKVHENQARALHRSTAYQSSRTQYIRGIHVLCLSYCALAVEMLQLYSRCVQVVLAHTPFRRLAAHTPLRDRPVVVIGGPNPAHVAKCDWWTCRVARTLRRSIASRRPITLVDALVMFSVCRRRQHDMTWAAQPKSRQHKYEQSSIYCSEHLSNKLDLLLRCRDYGFKQVCTLGQLHAAYPHAAPFTKRASEQGFARVR
jgi:hypothetical protein